MKCQIPLDANKTNQYRAKKGTLKEHRWYVVPEINTV